MRITTPSRLIDTFREYDEGQSAEVMTDMLESYIKGVRLQSVYAEVGKLYNENKQDKAEKTLREYAEWLAGFTLKSSSFVDVAATFKERFERNRRREEEEERSAAPRVSRFYIPYLDALNAGRNLRGQLTVSWPAQAWESRTSPNGSVSGRTSMTGCMCCISSWKVRKKRR